jgi:uncharacterized protein YecE (DUF72 family)
MSDQLRLFETEAEPPADPFREILVATHAEARAIAGQLPSDLHFGTSSWSFPGWAGIVYSSERTTTALAREGLREYAQHPLLTTVGIDRSYYAPIPVEDLRSYAEQLPNRFRCCIKAPAGVTAFTLGRPGGRAEKNPDFLSLDRLEGDLLQPLSVAFEKNAGPIILEFPPSARALQLEPAAFLDRLNRFLAALPHGFEYCVELRDSRLLTTEYAAMLAEHRVAHTFNYWSAMPGLAEQAAVVPPEDPPFSVVRLLLKPGTWYEDQREAFRPFNRIVEPDPSMRRNVVAIAGRALKRKKRVYILVNNKAEGSSPLTVMALARRFLEEVGGWGQAPRQEVPRRVADSATGPASGPTPAALPGTRCVRETSAPPQ